MTIAPIAGVYIAMDRDHLTISKGRTHADAIAQALHKRNIFPRVSRPLHVSTL